MNFFESVAMAGRQAMVNEFAKVALNGLLAKGEIIGYGTAHQALSMAEIMVEVLEKAEADRLNEADKNV